MSKKLFTIGHSTRSLIEFISTLEAYHVNCLVDIRSIPKSRHVPWFNQIELADALQQRSITYTHFPLLGGLRHASNNSINTGWYNLSFRGFADYMLTPLFYKGLKELNQLITKENVVTIMCAEALPWRCHRSLIADAEVIRHYKVWHIMNVAKLQPHKLTSFAKVNRKKRPIQILYPV